MLHWIHPAAVNVLMLKGCDFVICLFNAMVDTRDRCLHGLHNRW